MNFIIDFARSRGYEQVQLFVINSNTKTRISYHKMDPKKKKMHTLLFSWNTFSGLNGTFEMVYKIKR